MTIETNENGDVIIKADEAPAGETVETVLEAATEIAEMIDDARKDGEESATKIETVEELLFRVLEGQGFIVATLQDVQAQLGELRLQNIIAQDEIEEIVEEIDAVIVDEIPVVADTPAIETEITVEENHGDISIEPVPDVEAPTPRAKKSRKWI